MNILGRGTTTPEQIQAWITHLGPNYVGYAPDKKFKAPPSDLGLAIVQECQRYPEYVINHDRVACQIVKETAAWQSKYARERNNPGGIGAINSDPDQAIWFGSVFEGVRAHVAHLLTYAVGEGPWTKDTPRYNNVKDKGWVGKAPRWIDLNGKWAHPGTTYGQDILRMTDNLLTFAKGHTPMKPIIALAAGHHNSSGGGAVGEYERVGPLTREIGKQLRAHGGFDLRMITPNEGMGVYPGGLWEVTAAAVKENADCFIEIHMEGTHPSVRGCFGIYPDWGDDVDGDVRDRLAPDMSNRVSAYTGLPVRGSGAMSEKETHVGGQGNRLGAFNASSSARATMERTIFEYGALTNVEDKRIIDTPGFYDKAARATVEALASFYGIASPEPQPVEPPVDALYQPGNPFGKVPIVHGFRRVYEQTGAWKYAPDPMIGALSVFGYAKSAEYETSFGSAQIFERGNMLWYRDTPEPWDIVLQHKDEPAPEAK